MTDSCVLPATPNTAQTEGKVDVFNLAAGELPSLVCDLRPFCHFGPNGGRSLAGGCGSSVRNVVTCIWTGRVETVVLGRFNGMATFTHVLFEIGAHMYDEQMKLNGVSHLSRFAKESISPAVFPFARVVSNPGQK